MTDREKIRAEIERLINNHDSALDYEAALEDVRNFIDSLQEPKFKAGDHIRPIDSCLGSPRTIADVCDSWYVTDQGTLDFEYEDNWELAEEHKKCMYPKDNYTDEDREVFCDGCEDACKYAKLNTMLDDALSKETKESWNERLGKEEPVSEEWIEELRTKLDSMSKEDFKKVFDKYAIDFDEKPVSEFLNTESMIESYKQRLIAQANGMKNSPLVDMCLVSYKHGINETLDTLNLSNVKRYVKNWKEPVSEDLGEYISELSKQFPEVSFAKLSRIAVRVANWQKEQINEVLLSEVLPCFMHGGEADEVVAKLDEVLNKKK